jgi:hypothetical protein
VINPIKVTCRNQDCIFNDDPEITQFQSGVVLISGCKAILTISREPLDIVITKNGQCETFISKEPFMNNHNKTIAELKELIKIGFCDKCGHGCDIGIRCDINNAFKRLGE